MFATSPFGLLCFCCSILEILAIRWGRPTKLSSKPVAEAALLATSPFGMLGFWCSVRDTPAIRRSGHAELSLQPTTVLAGLLFLAIWWRRLTKLSSKLVAEAALFASSRFGMLSFRV